MEIPTKLAKGYELVKPDGGWGFVIALALIIIELTGMFQALTFGIIYGPFLENVGNVATDISRISSTCNTMICLSGLPANILLQKFSCRKVAIMGSFIYIIGSFATIFVTSPLQLTLTYGVLEGFGWGLTLSSVLIAFADYFNLRKYFIMNCVQTIVSLATTAFPIIAKFSIETFGFRGTMALLAANSLHLICAGFCLHPVKWHMKKRGFSTTAKIIICEVEETALLETAVERKVISSIDIESEEPKIKKRFTLLHVWNTVYKMLDLGLLVHPIYLNITFGLSLTFISEALFLANTPMLLSNLGFNQTDIAMVMTIHFICDVIGKLLLSLATAFVLIKVRYLQLMGMIIMAAFRMVLLFRDSYGWVAFAYAVLGLGRCVVENTIFLVFTEVFPQRHITSYTLFMVISGINTTICGQIMGAVMGTIQNKNCMVYAVTATPAFCAITWIIELVYTAIVKRNHTKQ